MSHDASNIMIYSFNTDKTDALNYSYGDIW